MQPVVAVVNTNPDLVELLKARIEAAGFVVLVIHIAEIRAGLDVGAVLSQHDPKVIVYDIVPPYERNWRFLQHLRETALDGRRFVLTSPNERALAQVVGRDERVRDPQRWRRHRCDRPGGQGSVSRAADELKRGVIDRRDRPGLAQISSSRAAADPSTASVPCHRIP